MTHVKRRVALVTGASRDIGRAISQALAAGGCPVACFGRDRASLDEAAALMRAAGGEASVCVGDAASQADLKAAVGHAVATFGGLDVVVNNADMIRKRIPMRRVAKLHEIGAFVAFFASDAAAFCTGEVHHIDGGQHMAY